MPPVPPSLRLNVVANFVGSLWPAVMAMVFIPLYVRAMGIEAFGLAGFFTTLAGVFALLDLGLSAAINREMARLSAQPDKASDMHHLARTVEIVYWLIAMLLGIATVVFAPIIAHRWLNAATIPLDTVQSAVMMMGLAMVFRWPYALYSGGLTGLQRQLPLNALKVAFETLRNVGALCVLWYVSSTITAFLKWQILVYSLHVASAAVLFWKLMPASTEPARFHSSCLRDIWKFAAGVTGMSLLSAFQGQLDKVLLSRLLPLNAYGYYMLASTAASGLTQVLAPFTNVISPRFAQLAALKDERNLAKLYHKSTQFMSIMVWPAVTVVACLSHELLTLWTRSSVTADHSYAILRLLILSAGMNSLLYLPLSLQVACGWLNLTIVAGIVTIFLQVPLVLWLTFRYGATGAASAWLLLNAAQMFFVLPILHRRLLPGELKRWYVQDIGIPAMMSFFFHTPLFPQFAYLINLCRSFHLRHFSMLLYSPL